MFNIETADIGDGQHMKIIVRDSITKEPVFEPMLPAEVFGEARAMTAEYFEQHSGQKVVDVSLIRETLAPLVARALNARLLNSQDGEPDFENDVELAG
jgi:hypothetical protein